MLAVTMIFCGTISSFATSDAKNSEKLNEISKKYELKDVKVSDIPEGIIPLKFDSAEELDKYLESLKANKKEEKPLIIKNTNNDFQANNNFQALASSYPTGSQSQKLSSFVTGSWNMSVTYTYDPDMKPKRFVSCSNISIYMSGITIGTNWKKIDDDFTLLDGRRTLYAKEWGVAEHYIILEGTGKIFEEPRTFDAYFYL